MSKVSLDDVGRRTGRDEWQDLIDQFNFLFYDLKRQTKTRQELKSKIPLRYSISNKRVERRRLYWIVSSRPVPSSEASLNVDLVVVVVVCLPTWLVGWLLASFFRTSLINN